MIGNCPCSRRTIIAVCLGILVVAIAMADTNSQVQSARVRCSVSIDEKAVDCAYRRLLKPPRDLPASVEYLDLSNNQLDGNSLLRLGYLKRVRYLRLNGNRIKNVHYDQFPHLSTLETLLLADNPLMFMEEAVFEKLPSLKYIQIDHHHHTSCDSRIIHLIKWLSNMHTRVSLLPSGKEIKCYDRFNKKLEIVFRPEMYRLDSHWTELVYNRRSKRSANSLDISQWSCNLAEKVIVLYDSTLSTNDAVLCSDYCYGLGFSLVLLDAPLCLCGQQMTSNAYNIHDCTYKCHKTTQKAGCDLTRRSYHELSPAVARGVQPETSIASYLSDLPVSTSTISTGIESSSTVKAGSPIDTATHSFLTQHLPIVSSNTERNSSMPSSSQNILTARAMTTPDYSSFSHMSTASHTDSSPNSQHATPALQSNSDGEHTPYASPKTSIIPGTSHTVYHIAFTSVVSELQRVVNTDHLSERRKRDVSSSASTPAEEPDIPSISRSGLTFTNESSLKIMSISVNVSFTQNGSTHLVRYDIVQNNINLKNSGLYILQSSSIAVPVHIDVTISLLFTIEKDDGVIVKRMYDGLVSNMSLTASENNTLGTSDVINSSIEEEFDYNIRFVDSNSNMLASIQLNFTSIAPVSQPAESLVQLNKYEKTSRYVHFAFGINHSHVEATWAVKKHSKVVYSNNSVCLNQCPSSLGNCLSYSCILTLSYYLQNNGEYSLEVDISNPVTTVAQSIWHQFFVETEITHLSISACDYTANVNQSKEFELKYSGDVNYIRWSVDGLSIANGSFTISYTAASLGNYTLSARAINNVSTSITHVGVSVFKWGSIHGLNISKPDQGQYKPTQKPVLFSALVCEGYDPLFHWNFGDGSNVTTNLSGTEHTFISPGEYTIILSAENPEGTTENRSLSLILQDEIENLTASASRVFVAVNDPVFVITHIDKGTSVNYKLKVDGKGQAYRFTGNVSQDFSFPNAGTYSLKITASNEVSTADVSISVTVQEMIELGLKESKYRTLKNSESFNAQRITGTDMYIMWEFGDGTKTNWSYINTDILPERHTYQSEGEYTVILHARNDVHSGVNYSSLVVVERALADGINMSLPTYAATNVTFLVNITLQDLSIYGYNASMDGHSFLLNSSFHQITKVYTQAGIFRLTLNAWNHVSSAPRPAEITVQDAIIGDITIAPMYVLQSTNVSLHVYVKGSDPMFEWNFRDFNYSINGNHIFRTFAKLGFMYFNVTATNKISSLTSQLKIQVQLKITDMSLSSNASFTAPEALILITSSIPKRSEHVYTWTIDGLAVNQSGDKIIRAFSTLGRHWVHLNLSNDVSSQTAAIGLYVQEPISGISIQLPKNATFVQFNETVKLYAVSASGSNMRFIWCIQLKCNTASNQMYITTVSSLDVLYLNATIIAENEISKDSQTKLIPVVQPIQDLQVLPTGPVIIIVNTSVKFDIMYTSGSHFSVEWRISGNSTGSNATTLTYNFTQPGNFKVDVLLRNEINSATSSRNVTVQSWFDITNINPTLVETNQIVVFSTVGLANTDVKLQWITPDVIGSKVLTNPNISLTFPVAGIYPLSVKGSNLVLHVNKTFYITVQDRAANLKVIPNALFYKTSSVVTFNATVTAGTNVTFAWKLILTAGNISCKYVNRPTINCPLVASGQYILNVVASNLISSITYSSNIYVQDATQIISLISTYGTVLPTNEDLVFDLKIKGTNLSASYSLQGTDNESSQPVANTRIKLVISNPGKVAINVKAWNKISRDSRVFHFIAQERLKNVSVWTAAELVPVGETVMFQAVPEHGTNLSYAWYINGTVLSNQTDRILNFGFKHEGTYEVKVTAKNGIVNSLKSSHAYVRVEMPGCLPPKIAIHGGEERTLFKSQWLYFEASIKYNCSTSSVNSSWSLRIAKDTTRCMVEGESLTKYNLGQGVDLTSTMLAIQPGKLQVGTYCLYYMAKYGKQGRFLVFNASMLKVVPTPPIPVLLGGTTKLVGQNQSFTLDASNSIDPDSRQPTGLLFQWRCSFQRQNPNATNAAHTGCVNTSWTSWEDGKQLFINAGSLTLGYSYTIVLLVKKPGGSSYSTSQKITVFPMTLPDVYITCVTCSAYKTSKYISNRSLKLLGTCSNCNTDFGKLGLLRTSWEVMSSSGNVTLNITKSQTEHTDLLIIQPGKLDGLSTYSIRFFVEVSSNIISRGYSQIFLTPNQAPENGTCDIEPRTGVTLETKFTFNCIDWVDSDNRNSPLIYWLKFQTTTETWNILYRGIRPAVSADLPVGDVNKQRKLLLQVLIEDIYGAQRVGLERNVTVYPPNEDPTKFLQKTVISSINLLTSENDMNKVVSITQASVKLLSGSGPIGTQQTIILSNITESASQMSAASLEAVDQLSNAIRSSAGMVAENALKSETRRTLTASLDRMINKVDSFASDGQLAGQASLESLLFLVQNNIASDTIRDASNRLEISHIPLEVKKNLNLAMKLYTAILRASIRGEDPSLFSNKYGKVFLRRDKSELLNRTLNAENCGFVLKKELGTQSDVFQIFNVSYKDPYISSSSLIESKIAGLSYSMSNGTEMNVKDLPDNETILIKLDGSPSRKSARSTLENKIIQPKTTVAGEMAFNDTSTIAAMLVVEIIPNSGSIGNINASLKRQTVLANTSAMFQLNVSRQGTLIKHFKAGEFNASHGYMIEIVNNDDKHDANLSVLVFSSSCVFWDRNNESWSSAGVTPTEETNSDFTVCRTTHLTSFASTFKIAPNPVRWSTLSELDVERNPIALSLCMTLIVLYVIGMFFLARKDEKDKQESHYIPMMGSDEFFKYEVRIKTGAFPGSGTTAHVGIQVYATKGATKPIVVAKSNSFQRNSVDIFRFATPTRLGKISRIRIWHDNSGSSPSWYLMRVVIKNLLNGQKYFMFCNRWLAVDRDDGEIERVFHVADSKLMSRFQTIFNDTIGRTFTDYHLWMSVFEKPKLSRFTRVQRLTCCMTFLLSWMCIDAMWYGTVRQNVDLYIGFKSFSYEEIIVGVISSLMVFPVNFIIIMIFRNCRQPNPRQIIDGDDEIAIHVLSKSHRTRRLSEDSVEIEDITESHALIKSSLPRCGGYFKLMSFNRFPSFGDWPSNLDSMSNHDSGDAEELSEASSVNKDSRATFVNMQVPNFLQTGHNYSRLPVSYGTSSDIAEDTERYEPRQGSSRCSTTNDVATISTNITTLSSRISEERPSSLPETESVPNIRPGVHNPGIHNPGVHNLGVHNKNNEDSSQPSTSNHHSLNDSFSSRRSSQRASTAIEKDVDEAHVVDDTVDDEELTRDLPDICELDSSLDCLLPHWFIGIAYLACLAISLVSILVILIYGQQFGKDKAISWLQSIFSGLIQDMFVTYPLLLILVALFLALIRKPMNLDYSDFVSCPVIPGDPSATSEPVRGYALELAQKQGRGKREIRRIIKNLAFQIVHLWLVLSICLISYESRMSYLKRGFEAELFPGKHGILEIDSIGKLWKWMETDLPNFLYPATASNEYWLLRSEPRMRQVRILSENCPDPDTAKTVNKNQICNPDFCNADIEKRNFLMNWTKPELSTGTPWSFKTEEELNGTEYIGRLAAYPHSGYLSTLGSTKSQFIAKVVSLKAAGWLDLRTRVLFIEFVMQNININRYAVNTVAFEFSSTGLVVPFHEVLYLRVHMYISRLDNFRLFCEVMFGLLTFYQLWLIQDKLRRRGRRFFDKFWNLHLLVSFASNACTVGISIYRLMLFLELRPFLKNGIPRGYDLRREATVDWSIQACFGFVCFLLITKVISLLSWTRAYRVAAVTHRRAIKHLLLLIFGLIVCLCAFASWGNLAFGSSYYNFHTFWKALLHTLLLRVWDLDQSNLLQDGQLMAWNMLCTFTFIAFVMAFFKSCLCVHYSNARLLYREGNKMHHGEIAKYLHNRFTFRKKKTAKRVKFSLNPSVRRNTLAMSLQTISLGSDQWLSSHSLSSYSHIPSYFRQHSMNQLTPITNEILQYVHQLERDELLEDEFYSKLESIANNTLRIKRPKYAFQHR